MGNNLSSIVSAYRELKGKARRFVLATIVETLGSTYRKAGARMLIDESDEFYGLLGGGCFEGDLLEHARKVFRNRRAETVLYDMRGPEDVVWGLGLGCNGAVRILLEELSPENDYRALELIAQGLAAPGILATICESEHPDFQAGQSFFFPQSGAVEVEVDPRLRSEIRDTLDRVRRQGSPELRAHVLEGKSIRIFYASVEPPPGLLIIGAGPDASPVARFAKELGWAVHIVDYREGFAKPERFPEADNVALLMPEDLLKVQDAIRADATVLMTHHFERDAGYLRQLAQTSIPYVGLLGPAARRERLLDAIGRASSARLDGRVFGPVGLDLGGELPEEIALSLVAEIQATRHRRSAGSLSRQATAVPRKRAKDGLYAVVLAAGGSRRFGRPKQLLECGGKSLLRRSVETACDLLGRRVVVVHGRKAGKCWRDIADIAVENVVNKDWKNGMASSLATGIRALPENCEGALILLCDQPLVTADDLRRLIDVWERNTGRIASGAYADTFGVPALVPKRYFPELLELTGDRGAKCVLARYEAELSTVPIPNAALDLDTRDDYAQLLRQLDRGP